MPKILWSWLAFLPGILLANTAMSAGASTNVVVYSGQPIAGSTRSVGSTFNPTTSISSNGTILMSDSWGLLINDGGVLRFLAEGLTPSPLPGEDYWFPSGGFHALATGDYPSGAGSVLYVTSSQPSNKDMLVSEHNGTGKLLAHTGQDVPGVPGRKYTQLAYGSGTKYVAMSESGEAAFLAVLDSGSSDNDNALFYEDGKGNVSFVIREGDPAPGLPAGSIFVTLKQPVMAGPDMIVFAAGVRTPTGSQFYDTPSIWRIRITPGCNPLNTCLEKLIMADEPVPGIGGDSRIENLQTRVPAVNGLGGIAFIVNFDPDPDQFNDQETGIFMSSGPNALPGMVYRSGPGADVFKPQNVITHALDGSLFLLDNSLSPRGIHVWKNGRTTPLLLDGDAPEGLPADVSLTGSAAIAINKRGQIAIMATLQGASVERANNNVIYGMQSLDHPMEFAFREGGLLPVAGGECQVREMLLNSPDTIDGQQSLFNERGEFIWWGGTAGENCPSRQLVVVTTFGPPPPVPAELVAVEVVQSVQDWNNSIVLVEGKKTFVHAHFQSNTGGDISPRLYAFKNAVELPGGPLTPDNPGMRVPLAQNAVASRGALNRRARFTLPPEWTTGAVTFEVDGGSDPINCNEPSGESIPNCEVDVTFVPVETPKIRFFDLAWRDGPLRHTVNQAATKDLVDRLVSAYPITKVDWRRTGSNWPGFLNSPPKNTKFSRMIASMKVRRKKDNCSKATECKEIYYGVVAMDSLEGQADDIPSSVAVSFIPSNPVVEGRHTHSHEIGHVLGLPHSVDSRIVTFGGEPVAEGDKSGWCGSVADDTARDFKYLNVVKGRIRPTLGPMYEGDINMVYGYDSKQRLLVDPFKIFDMMSYCSSVPIDFWPSEDAYTRLKASIDDRFKVESVAQASPVAANALVTGDYMLIRGIVDLEGPTAELMPVTVAEDILPPDNPPAGDYLLRLRNSAGTLLDEISFEVRPTVVRGTPGTEGEFVISVPVDGAIQRIEILHGGSIIAFSEASDNTPVLSITSPDGIVPLDTEFVDLQWSASDTDGDQLIFDVQYSGNGGTNWATLVTDYNEKSLMIARNQLPASAIGVLRVSASDGFNVTSAQTASLVVENNPPAVYVDSPVNGNLFVADQTVYLEATALDPEDLFLQGPAFTWSSDRDGVLGSGNPLLINASALQNGEHLITVTAADSQAAEGSAQVLIRVSQTAPDTLADLAVNWLIGDPVLPFGQHTLVLRLVNNGPESATNANLDFSLLEMIGDIGALQSISAPGGWSCTGSSCSTGMLEVDVEAEFEVQIELLQGTPQLNATASSVTVDPATGNNDAPYTLVAIPDPGAVFSDSFE